MLELIKIRKDINWLIEQIKCLINKSNLTTPLSATEWSTNHSLTEGNPYNKKAFTWYNGHVYESLVDDNQYPPTNATYWTDLGEGHQLLEEQSDWDATTGRAFIRNKPVLLEEAPDDGSQYVRKNEAWDKLTTYSEVDPNSGSNVVEGFPLGSDWYNTVTGEKFYQKGNGVWISYTSGTTPPTPGGDSPVMFADYATNERLYVIYNEDPNGDQLISTSNEVLFVDGVAMQVGDTVLVKDQPTYVPIDEINISYQNGVYIVTDIGSLTSSYILTRTDYANETSELYPSQVNILKGTSENRFFLQKTVEPVIGLSDIIYEINYVPATQTVVLPVIHVDTATTAPLPSCTYEDVFAPPVGGIYLTSPSTSYLTATTNGPLGVINGVNMSISFLGARNRKILIKNQIDPVQNGDYEVIQIGSSVQPWKLRRITTTYSSFDKNVREWKINNEASTLYGNRYYMNYTGSFGTVGVDSITFSELTYALPTVTPSLQDVIDVNKVADRVEFTFTPFKGSAFTGGFDYLIDFMESNQDDGIYIYGDFAQYGTSTGQDIVKVNSDGSVDTSFNVGTGFNNYPFTGSGKLAQTAAGKIYATGAFTTYNGTTVNKIVRLNTNGTIDTSFVTGSGFTGGSVQYTNSIGLDSFENVYVAGAYTAYNGTSAPTFIKLLPNGSIDTSFVIGSGFNNVTTAVLVNADNTLFVGGHFGTYKGVSSPRFIKLLPNGDIDTSFVIGSGFDNIVTNIVKTLDNKIIVTGHFTTYKGVPANKIIKLNFDGSVDTSFNTGTGFSSTGSYSLKILADGKLLIRNSGTYNGVSITGMLILNTNGSIYLNSAHSFTGYTQLSDGRFIGMSNAGLTNNYLVQIINGLPIKDQKLTFSEITGKAEYTIDTLDGTTTYELLPKHLIQQLINSSTPVAATPTLQQVTDVGANTTNTITVGDLASEFSQVLNGAVGTQNAVTGKYAYIDSTGQLGLHNGTVESNLRNDNVSNPGVILQYPGLPTGSYTIATTDDIALIPTPTLQQVTYAGNTTTDVIISSLGFETTLFGTINQMAFMGITSINSSGIITYKGLLSLQAGSLDGTGFMSYLTSDNLSQDRFLKLPNKNGTLAITTDIPAAQVNSNWNATSGVAQILNKPLIPIVDSVPTYGSPNAAMSGGVFDALALKADLVAGKVPSTQLPSYVDDVIEGYYSAPTFYSNAGLTTPIVPETGKIYVDLLANKSYRWSGSVYIQISNAISSIDELTDVTVTSPLNGQLLQYNSTTSQWENQSITVGTGDMQKSTYDIDNDGIVDFAETVPVVVRNPSVSDILRKGTIIYLNGSTGYRPNAYKAQANAEATSSGTFGVVLADIATNSDGTVAMLGTMHTLDTRNAATGAPFPFTNDILVDGDVLWLDPFNAGYVTKTKPQAPNHIVFIGVVARSHPSLGRIVYRITNGYELDELHNVFINGTLADNHILYYDLATLLWKTKTIAQVLGFTPQQAITVTTTGTSGPATLSGGILNIPQYSGGGGTTDINIINATKLTLMYNT